MLQSILKMGENDYKTSFSDGIHIHLELGDLRESLYPSSKLLALPGPTQQSPINYFYDYNYKFNDNSWKTCSAASLRGHIVNVHFQARTLADLGVARYDIEIAAHRGIPLYWVARKAYERLERDDADIAKEISEHEVADKLTVDEYRTMLVKNLKYIECLNLACIDWKRVNVSFDGASEIELDIDKDGRDMSFLTYIAPFLNKTI